MGEFMTWQAKLEHKNGDAVRNILDVEYSKSLLSVCMTLNSLSPILDVDGDAKMTAEGVGTTTTTVERSKFGELRIRDCVTCHRLTMHGTSV